MKPMLYAFFSLLLSNKAGSGLASAEFLHRIQPNSFRFQHSNYFRLFVMASLLLLSACSTVPIQNRNVSTAGGYWELDENTDPRFYHSTKAGQQKIGTLYVAGSNVFVNDSQVQEGSETGLINNAFVSTGPQSSARIEFEDDNGTCLIQIQDFSTGNSYGDTANCEHMIETTHAESQTRDSIYHINVSRQQTELTVLDGLIRIALRTDPSQFVIVKRGEEAILTANSIIGPRPISPEEIIRRIQWRDRYEFYTSKVSWGKALLGGAAAAAIVYGILRKSGNGGSDGGDMNDYDQTDVKDQTHYPY